MSDERLTKAGRSDDARLIDAAARERLAVAVADIRLPNSLRLTEWQRATIRGLAGTLIQSIEDELRTALAEYPVAAANEALHAALTSARVPLAAPILERSGTYADAPLVGALIRRAEEHRRARTGGGSETGLLVELIRDEDDDVAEQAMAILVGHSRRYDRFGEPIAERTELSGELEHRLAWRVAAALRLYMVEQHGIMPADADAAVVTATQLFLGGYDEGESLESRSMQLMRRIQRLGRLDDAFVQRSLTEGSLTLFLSAVAARSGLSHMAAWALLSDPSGRGTVWLLRAAAVGRSEAGAILVSLAATEEEATGQLDRFDVTSALAARDALRFWHVDPAYREALAEIAA